MVNLHLVLKNENDCVELKKKYFWFCCINSDHLAPTLPTTQLNHRVASVETIDQITSSFLCRRQMQWNDSIHFNVENERSYPLITTSVNFQLFILSL